MPTREVLAPAERPQFTEIPNTMTEQDLARYFTLSPDDLAIIRQRRRPHNRLGFAVQLGYLRFPGRPLRADETVPASVLGYLATQLDLDPQLIDAYARARDTTRREHVRQLMQLFSFRAFNRNAYRELARWLLPTALSTDSGTALVAAVVDELRSRRIVAPALYLIERLVWETRRRAQQQVVQLLTATLSAAQQMHLDALLTAPDDQHRSRLAWLREPPGKPGPATILKLVERLRFVRSFGLDPALARQIHQNRLLQLVREGSRYSPMFLRRFEAPRRYATLVAFLLETAATLIDQLIDQHDRIVSQYLRRSEQTHAEQFHQSGKAINEKVRLYAAVGTALIGAREQQTDPYAAVEAVLPWPMFLRTVAEADQLAQPTDFDYLDQFGTYFTQFRRYAPDLLEVLEFRGVGTAQPLVHALQLLRTMNAAHRKKVPNGAPLGFIKPRWEAHVLRATGIDRHYYELCALVELRNALRAGDVWVVGSRQYRAFEDYLLPSEAWQQRKAEGTVPLHGPRDAATYLAEQRERLHEQLRTTARLLADDQLPDVHLRKGRISLAPLQSTVPADFDRVLAQLDALQPWVKVTDLLMVIDEATGFSRHFTHLHTGAPTRDRESLFAAILADGTNLGVSKMAQACPDMSVARLTWLSDWYLRDDTYRKALAAIVNEQHRRPFAGYWGDGTTSSSDAQRFVTGGRREPLAQVNARYGRERSIMFYTHVSDRYAPFHVKAISATVHQAPYVLDGLLYHETDVQIQEHYTDTGGATDHLFALCPPLGFRFAPRLRDLHDRRLYTIEHPASYGVLEPMIGGSVNLKRIANHWDDVQRLLTSIKVGTVTASLILRKLAAYPRQNALAVALRDMGRIERTLYTLQWYQDPNLRRRATVGLNKGEGKHALNRAVFFNRRGLVQDRSYEDQVNRANGLNLLTAAIVLWNTLVLEQAVATLQTQGVTLTDAQLQHLAPLAWEKIILTGEYRWNVQQAADLVARYVRRSA